MENPAPAQNIPVVGDIPKPEAPVIKQDPLILYPTNVSPDQEEPPKELNDNEKDFQVKIDDYIRQNNKEIIHLKNENKDLRENLKLLNEKLTATLEKLKVRTFKHKDQTKTKAETLERELINTKKKITAYGKEIEFLEARIDQGDQLDRINILQDELYQKNLDEDILKKQLRRKAKEAKISEKTLKQTKDDDDHSTKINYILEETKYLNKKLKGMENKINKENEQFVNQKQFATKLNQRYIELCSQVGEKPTIELNLEGEEVTFKKIGVAKPRAPKPKKIDHVSEYWTNDHPDRFQVQMNPILFNQLKDKVRALKKSDTIKGKSRVKKLNKTQERSKKMEKESEMIEQKLVEKEKEFELLIQQLNEAKRGMKHNALLPLENMIRINELQDEYGRIIMKVGNCYQIIGSDIPSNKTEHQNLRLKLIKFWEEPKTDLLNAIKGEYFPNVEMPFYGQLTPSVPKLVCISFHLKDGKILEFGRTKKPEPELDAEGNPVPIETPEEEEITFDTEVDFPLYDKVKQIHVYGVNHQLTGLGFEIQPQFVRNRTHYCLINQ